MRPRRRRPAPENTGRSGSPTPRRVTAKKTAIARIKGTRSALGPPDAGETAGHECEQRGQLRPAGRLEEREVEVAPGLVSP